MLTTHRIRNGERHMLRLTAILIVSLILPMNLDAKENDAKPLKVGDVAPEFVLKGSDGNTYKLSDYKGKSAVIVAWYPKALTGG